MKKIKITQTKYLDAQKYLFSELYKIINDNKDSNNITTNGNIASVLQDSLMYNLNDNLTIEQKLKQKFYKIGNFENLSLMVDSIQLWTDNIIYLKNNEEIIETIEIINENDILI